LEDCKILPQDYNYQVHHHQKLNLMTLVIPDEFLQATQLTITQLQQEFAQWLWQKHYVTLEQARQLLPSSPSAFQQPTVQSSPDEDKDMSVPVNLGKLANLKRRDCIIGDPEDLVHIDWSKEWKP
jgi:hypothetical protein